MPVTREDLKANIVSAHYFMASDAIQQENAVHEPDGEGWHLGRTQLLTICVLQLRNGSTVTGESAWEGSKDFNAEIGRAIARANAELKLLPLMSYSLTQRLHEVTA